MSQDFRSPESIGVDQLCSAATAATGLGDFGEPSFLEGLHHLCTGLRRSEVRFGGRAMLANEVIRMLSNRLRATNYRKQHPELDEVEIEAPVVILGLPRTGTTVLSYLLDQDPAHRSLLNWEAVNSVPPPTDETLRNDPRCIETLDFQRAVIDSIDPPPPHWEWADGPTECTFLIAQDFKSVMWESRLPNPDYRDFISTCDMGSAYRYHRQMLQLLGSQTTGTWVLKMPAHAYFIDAVLAEYPDARFIWSHRDPATATASFMNLAAFSHGLTLQEPNIDWIVNTYPHRLVEQVERPMRALAGRDVHHVHFRSFMADPIEAMRGIYDWLGRPLTPELVGTMQGWLDADPLAASRKSSYNLDDFGIQRDELLERFSFYTDAFNVELDQ